MLYVWKIRQSEVDYLDTYDSAVVVASTEDEARKIHPCERDANTGNWPKSYRTSWASTWENVSVEKLGRLESTMFKAGDVVCSSFNAS